MASWTPRVASKKLSKFLSICVSQHLPGSCCSYVSLPQRSHPQKQCTGTQLAGIGPFPGNKSRVPIAAHAPTQRSSPQLRPHTPPTPANHPMGKPPPYHPYTRMTSLSLIFSRAYLEIASAAREILSRTNWSIKSCSFFFAYREMAPLSGGLDTLGSLPCLSTLHTSPCPGAPTACPALAGT